MRAELECAANQHISAIAQNKRRSHEFSGFDADRDHLDAMLTH
jgi:hypothetical protein